MKGYYDRFTSFPNESPSGVYLNGVYLNGYIIRSMAKELMKVIEEEVYKERGDHKDRL